MDEVHVHRLRLSAGRQGPPAGLAARVEDALRTSTKPPALAHRRVWIKRLRLNAPRGASAQTLALLFEREWAAVAAGAEPLATAGPKTAAVWAVDEGEARLWLLRRWVADLRGGVAAGAPDDPWFCARIAPRASRQSTAAQRIASLLFEPWDEGGPARQHAWRVRAWAALVERGLAPTVWAACDAGQRAVLAAIATPAPVGASGLGAPVAPAIVAAVPPAAPAIDDVRAGPNEPTLLGPEAAAERPDAAGAWTWAAPRPPEDPAPRSTRPSVPLAAPAAPLLMAAATEASTPARASPPPAAAAPLTSDWAGLALLLPVLLRAGYGDDAGPRDAALCVALLARAAQRHRADAAAQAWIAQWSAWHDAPVAAEDLSAWGHRMRLATLRDARLPLRRLIQRPGEIWSSPHRLDVVYPLRVADLRIRRAGFDLDPGYLPWLDTVIRIHYA
jgi:hypothetical protein